jgi:hypothetical protein
MDSNEKLLISRRHALMLGSGLIGGLFAADLSQAASKQMDDGANANMPSSQGDNASLGKLPVKQMEEILRSEGTVADGVLSLSQDRTDLHVVNAEGLLIKPAWQVNHEFAFQSIGKDKAIANCELSLLSKEANPVMDQLIKHGLEFQAFHQHFFDLSPQIFHIHFRGVGHPLELARAIAAVVSVTGTPLPQKSPVNPKSPLDKNKLEKILGGTAEIADDGVVIVTISRRETIVLGGVTLKSDTGVSHIVAFQPLAGATKTAAAPDFALIAAEINPVVQEMRTHGFTIHCLYNQETAESPQLYYSHQLAVGDAYDLARKIRKGLDLTNTKFKS